MKRWSWLLIVLLGLWIGLGFSQSAEAAIAQPDRQPLTLELLQQRLKTPSQIEGINTLDLRRLIIDLRPENEAFRTQFYRLLRNQLQRANNIPLALDLSYSLVRGELNLSDLGLRAPLYGEAQSSLFSEQEQVQLRRDRRRLTQLSQLSRSLLTQVQPPTLQITLLRGPLRLTQTQFEGFANFTNTFFLGRVEAQGTEFLQETDWSETRFSQPVSFAGAVFHQQARFRGALFFQRAGFNQTRFQGNALFQSSEFRGTANFSKALFQQTANFTRIQFQGNADFAQTQWQGAASFSQSGFDQALFLSESAFERPVNFREARFSQPINLRGATIQAEADWGDASFAPNAYLNVTGLQFNPDDAKLLGNPGQIGRVFSVPVLQGNETLLRNLRRNFRLLEQVADANQIEYLTQKLRQQQIQRRLLGANLNTASPEKLLKLGFSAVQVAAIAQFRQQEPFRNLTDLLRLDGVDLATYVRLKDGLVASPPRSLSGWLGDGLLWLGLSLLLLLTRFGSNAWLTLGVGMVAIAFFAILFWLIDRLRRLRPNPIVPTVEEGCWMVGGTGTLVILGLMAIFRTAERPWLTLTCLSIVTVPVPVLLTAILYWRGRYHDQMEVSYFSEEGTLRQLRVLIGRLPVLPRYPLFRERYMPLLWDRRWNWLNYVDFSFNNLLRFGFNDIRLRDEHLPGLITALVWYQWSLGMLYIALLLWTLSRTIPGLNLLIYFK